jgi:hypothetical protein
MGGTVTDLRLIIGAFQQGQISASSRVIARRIGTKTWETTMGLVHTAQDPIEARLNQIIEDIEKTCRPAIQELVQ